jgi:hypothetical protein
MAMRGHPEAAAAVVNAVIVVVVPLAYVWLAHAWFGAMVDGAMLATSAATMAPFAALAAWRTWVHSTRWLAREPALCRPVAEAASTAGVVALAYLARGILTRPADAPAYVIVYGGAALMLGAIVGLVLRTTAVLALTLDRGMFADHPDRGAGRNSRTA